MLLSSMHKKVEIYRCSPEGISTSLPLVLSDSTYCNPLMPWHKVIQLVGGDKNAKKEGRGVPAEIWHH